MATKQGEFTKEIISLAEEKAREMLVSGAERAQFNFGHLSGELWLSRSSEGLISFQRLEVDGQEFFIGLSKKEE